MSGNLMGDCCLWLKIRHCSSGVGVQIFSAFSIKKPILNLSYLFVSILDISVANSWSKNIFLQNAKIFKISQVKHWLPTEARIYKMNIGDL
jgi:hypothetical protein